MEDINTLILAFGGLGIVGGFYVIGIWWLGRSLPKRPITSLTDGEGKK